MTDCPAKHAEPADGAPVWCLGHRAGILEALAAIPTWLAWLAAEDVERTATHGEKVGKTTKATHAPTPSSSVDQREELALWVHDWVVEVARHIGHAGPVIDTVAGTPHQGASVAQGLPYLLAQTEFWLDDEDFPVDLGEEALAFRGRIEQYVRRDDPFTHLYSPCPTCDAVRLGRRNGASYVLCMACGATWPEEEYEELARLLLA